MEQLIQLKTNNVLLEEEKEKFMLVLFNFIDGLNFDNIQINGRPKSDLKDVLKSLLVMSYNNMSYRRARSDLRKLYDEDLIHYVPRRSTLNNYADKEEIRELLEELIQISSVFFMEYEDTVILDSTWFGLKMYIGGHKRVHDKKNIMKEKCRKLHIACLKNSKIIACAKTTPGNKNDSPMFRELINPIIKNGFIIKSLLADAGYSSKKNYALCKRLGIKEVFIDFRSNAGPYRSKNDLWKQRLRLFRENKDYWHEHYRYRPIIEGVFSAIKRKNVNYLRSKREMSQDIELLLKALVYNLTIIGRFI